MPLSITHGFDEVVPELAELCQGVGMIGEEIEASLHVAFDLNDATVDEMIQPVRRDS